MIMKSPPASGDDNIIAAAPAVKTTSGILMEEEQTIPMNGLINRTCSSGGTISLGSIPRQPTGTYWVALT